jgi:inosine-uridine nucleoside N-ribohydrolase
MGALFMSEGDDISPLSGVELVKEKCDRVIIMAGCFVDTYYTGSQNGARMPEFNARHDTPATQTVVERCPVPIVFLPFETGWDMNFGKAVIAKLGDSQVLPKAFIEYPYNRDGDNYSWDPATVVYAIEGCRDFFEESEWGTVTVDDKGTTYHTPDPNGKHRVLNMKKIDGKTEQDVKDAVGRYLDEIAIKLYEI